MRRGTENGYYSQLFVNGHSRKRTALVRHPCFLALSVLGVSILFLDIGKGKPESELAQKEGRGTIKAGSFGDRVYPQRITNVYQLLNAIVT